MISMALFAPIVVCDTDRYVLAAYAGTIGTRPTNIEVTSIAVIASDVDLCTVFFGTILDDR